MGAVLPTPSNAHVYVYVYVNVHHMYADNGAQKGQTRVCEPLKWKLQEFQEPLKMGTGN